MYMNKNVYDNMYMSTMFNIIKYNCQSLSADGCSHKPYRHILPIKTKTKHGNC